MRPPADLHRHARLFQEAGHAPGVDELSRTLRFAGDLGIPLRNVDDAGAGALRQRRPARSIGGHVRLEAERFRKIAERRLHEMAHESRIGAVTEHRARSLVLPAGGGMPAGDLVIDVLGAFTHRLRRIPGHVVPGLDGGIDVSHAGALTPVGKLHRVDAHRDVHEHVAGRSEAAQNLAQVVPLDTAHRVADAALPPGPDCTRVIVAVQHAHALRLDRQSVDQHRQETLPDGAETHHQDTAVEVGAGMRTKHSARTTVESERILRAPGAERQPIELPICGRYPPDTAALAVGAPLSVESGRPAKGRVLAGSSRTHRTFPWTVKCTIQQVSSESHAPASQGPGSRNAS